MNTADFTDFIVPRAATVNYIDPYIFNVFYIA